MKDKTIGMELRSLNNLIKRYIENSRHFEYAKKITGTNGWIIAYLAENEDKDIYQKDLEEKFTITRSTISKVITLMEQKGLIEREAVAGDARLKKLSLTPKAKALHKAIVEDLKDIENKLMEGFTEQEKENLFLYFDKMKKNMGTDEA